MKPSNLIAISDCPFSGFKRAVGISNFTIDFQQKIFIINSQLNYFQVDTNQTDHYGNKLSMNFNMPLVATRGKYLDPSDGHPVTVVNTPNPLYDPNNPTAQPEFITTYTDQVTGANVTTVATQYDYYYGIATTQPIIVANILNALIVMEDAMKTFNDYSPLS